MKSNQELAEEKYPMPNKEEYHDKALLLHPAGQAFSDLAREYMDLQIEASKQRSAFLAGIEADRWMPISSAAFNLMSQKEVELVVILFDTGEICRYYEDWPFAIATHYFSIPLPPKSITTE